MIKTEIFLGFGDVAVGAGTMHFYERANAKEYAEVPSIEFEQIYSPVTVGTKVNGRQAFNTKVVIIFKNLKGLEILKQAILKVEEKLKEKNRIDEVNCE